MVRGKGNPPEEIEKKGCKMVEKQDTLSKKRPGRGEREDLGRWGKSENVSRGGRHPKRQVGGRGRKETPLKGGLLPVGGGKAWGGRGGAGGAQGRPILE